MLHRARRLVLLLGRERVGCAALGRNFGVTSGAFPSAAHPVASFATLYGGVSRLTRVTFGLAGCSVASGLALALARPAISSPSLPPTLELPPPDVFELLPRAGALIVLFLPVLLLAPFAYVVPPLRRFFYALLAKTLGRAGAAFIKVGQWTATRPDLFPPALCSALSVLHRGVPPHSLRATRDVIREAFGLSIEELFLSFDPEPVGSGSIAQVYSAVLRRSSGGGERVAVKVRHPGVEERLRTDFALLSRLAQAADQFPALSWLGLGESIGQFATAVGAQARLDVEASHLETLRANFSQAPHIYVRFPKPDPQLRAPGVLVESFEEGAPLDAAVASARAGAAAYAGARATALAAGRPPPPPPPRAAASLDPATAACVVRAGMEAYLNMLLINNFLHSDLHPGNIMLRQKAGRAPVLVLVDAGMVDVLSAQERAAFVGLFQAMGEGDGAAAAGALLECGSGPPDAARDDAFKASLAKLFDSHCRGFRTGTDVGAVLRATLSELRHHQIRIDGRSAAALVNLLCIESFAEALQPDYNILDGSEGLLRAHKMLGPTALRFAAAATSPAVAAYREVSEMISWRVPASLPREYRFD